MPSNEGNEPPYFWQSKRRRDTEEGKSDPDVVEICLPSCSSQIHTCAAIAAELQFAKLLDLVSNAQIVEFGGTGGMRYPNWPVGCTEG